MKLVWMLLWALAAQAATVRYWVQPCTNTESGCKSGDPELAGWAMDAWQTASGGRLTLEKVPSEARAQIRVYWATKAQGLYGEARPIEVDGQRGAEVYVRPLIVSPDERDALLRDVVVYLTCLHETGHALGLPHTAAFADIMYSFQHGGDIREYFGRYRRLLGGRGDIREHPGMSDADRKRLGQLYD
jgi:hypothetical protein